MAVTEYSIRIYLVLTADTKPTPPGDGASLLYESDGAYRWFIYQNGAWHQIGGVVATRLITGATYSVLASDLIIGVNRAGPVTITLPSAVVVSGRRLVVKDESGLAGTNNITIDTEGAALIDGVASQVINTNYGSMGFYSNGTDWFTL